MLLERKRKEEEEARRREREQQDRMAKMPAWKREIIERRRAKQGSSTSFSEPGGSSEGGGGSSGGAGPPLAGVGAPSPGEEPSSEESAVLQEKIGPVHQNPFIQLEKRRKETAAPDSDPASAKAKQLADTYSQIPGIRTLRADNVIIIESVPDVEGAPLGTGAERRRWPAEVKSGSVESLNELLVRPGGSVTEIRAGEVFIVKSTVSRSAEDLNSCGQGHGDVGYQSARPEQRRGRVSKLLSHFSQDGGGVGPPQRPVRSLSTENLADGSYEHPLETRKLDPGLARQHGRSSSPSCDLPGLGASAPPQAPLFTVASFRNQFEARSSGEAWLESPPRRFSLGKSWNQEAASPERGPRLGSDSRAAGTVPPGSRGREATSPERRARPSSGDRLAAAPGPQSTEAALPESGAQPRGGGSVAAGPGLKDKEALSPEWGARHDGSGPNTVMPSPQGKEAASPERGGWDLKATLLDVMSTGEALEPGPAAMLEPDADTQAKALASLRLQSRNSFMVVPRRASSSPPPSSDAAEPRQETGTSPSPPPKPVAVLSSASSLSCEQTPPPASAEEPGDGEAMRRVGARPARELGGVSLVPHPAVQRRSGNTITINPRKAPVPAPTVENGIEGVPGSDKAAMAPVKKRYPTAEEIQVIGGYLSLQRSCLAKNDPHRKKVSRAQGIARIHPSHLCAPFHSCSPIPPFPLVHCLCLILSSPSSRPLSLSFTLLPSFSPFLSSLFSYLVLLSNLPSSCPASYSFIFLFLIRSFLLVFLS